MDNNSKILTNYKGIIDSTLREGQQFLWADFNLDQQKKIVKLLTQIGVERIEVGNPTKEITRGHIQRLVQIKKRSPLFCHVRNRLSDIKAAIETGVEGVNILCTVDQERLKGMGLSFSRYLNELRQSVLLAKDKGLKTRVSVEDYFRSHRKRAMQVYHLADTLGVERIGVADTSGVAMSWEVIEEIKTIRKIIKSDIEVHFHNDLDQATSNALAALAGGANWVNTTLLGIGERTGITPLSTFLASLYLLNHQFEDRYRLNLLTKAENSIARMIGKEIPFNLLTNQENAFSHKAGIHLNALINYGPQKYEPFPPKVIGNQRRLIWGTSISGKTTKKEVMAFYQKYGKK